jgi:hypothetical protein
MNSFSVTVTSQRSLTTGGLFESSDTIGNEMAKVSSSTGNKLFYLGLSVDDILGGDLKLIAAHHLLEEDRRRYSIW